MSESGNEERAELNIQASSAVEDKKVTPAWVKVKRGSELAGVKKVKKEPMLAADHGDNDKGKEGVTADYVDPTRPFEDQNLSLARFPEWCCLRSVLIAKSMPNDIIIPDPTPKKIFLDTIRLLAEKTDNLVDEVWTYIKGKKLVEASILLLAAQEQIRGSSSKRNVDYKQNGFFIIICRINELYGNSQLQLNEKTTLNYASLLVCIIFEAGEVLDGYIQRHSRVPHAEVIESVSSILKDFGYYPTGEGIDIKNLYPYDCKMSDIESHDIGHADATEAGKITAAAAVKMVVRKKKVSGWDPDYSRRMFFPYWRSVLLERCIVRIYPAYAPAPGVFEFDSKVLLNSRRDSMGNVLSTNLNHNLAMLGKTQQPASYLPRRLFTTAFTGYGCSQYPNYNHCLLGGI